tara:strand:+ start:257 stop:865 length:609 start_codon:yes stop_codon:yes gene_type:complete
MSKSSIIQIGIIIMILFVGYFIYSYLNKEKIEDLDLNTKLKKAEEVHNKNDVKSEVQASNTILELSYKSSDDSGNVYEINSISGAVNEDDKNILFLETVTAKISIIDYGIFLIESNNAKYNKLTLDTHFSGDVNLHYLDHIIKSEDLFLKYLNKEVKISNNVKYNSNSNLLEADEIYLDLVSRTSKIYMKDKTQKVKAIIKN